MAQQPYLARHKSTGRYILYVISLVAFILFQQWVYADLGERNRIQEFILIDLKRFVRKVIVMLLHPSTIACHDFYGLAAPEQIKPTAVFKRKFHSSFLQDPVFE